MSGPMSMQAIARAREELMIEIQIYQSECSRRDSRSTERAEALRHVHARIDALIAAGPGEGERVVRQTEGATLQSCPTCHGVLLHRQGCAALLPPSPVAPMTAPGEGRTMSLNLVHVLHCACDDDTLDRRCARLRVALSAREYDGDEHPDTESR